MFQPIGLKLARTPGSALRGGGGTFGVVTRFSFRLHQVGPTITGGLIVWSAERAAEVLAAYRDLTEQAPRELTAAVIVLAPPAIQPFSTGGNYVDFQLAGDAAARTADAYGNNYQRLQQVKATHDPDNLFRVNRNIPPAA
ncbi:MAG TPA: BBE domain-containing protein [Actinomycetota bacterium]